MVVCVLNSWVWCETDREFCLLPYATMLLYLPSSCLPFPTLSAPGHPALPTLPPVLYHACLPVNRCYHHTNLHCTPHAAATL